MRVLIGQAFGASSPVAAFSQTLYLDVTLPAGGAIELPALAPELALYPVLGEVSVDGEPFAVQAMAVLQPGESTLVTAGAPARFVVIGGEPLDGPRHMWWNFVSSRKERIIEASADWEAQRMGQVPGDTSSYRCRRHALLRRNRCLRTDLTRASTTFHESSSAALRADFLIIGGGIAARRSATGWRRTGNDPAGARVAARLPLHRPLGGAVHGKLRHAAGARADAAPAAPSSSSRRQVSPSIRC